MLGADERSRRRRRSTTSGTASRSRWTPTTGRCTSTSPTRPTRSSGPTQGIFPTLFEPMSELPDGPARPRPLPGGAVQRPDPRPGPLPRHRTRCGSSRTTTCGPCPTGQTNEQSLPSEAYYVVMRMPGEPKAEFLLLQPMIPISRPEHDRLGRRPQRRRGLRHDPCLPLPVGDDDLRPGPDRGPHRPGPDHQRAVHAVAQLGQRRHPRQPHRRARSATRCCTSSRSTSSRPASAFPEFRRIVVASPRQVVWGKTLAEALRLLLEREGGAAPSPSPTPTTRPRRVTRPEPERRPQPSPSTDPGEAAAGRRDRAHRLRQPPLRARPGTRCGPVTSPATARRSPWSRRRCQRLDELAPGLSAPSPGAASPAPRREPWGDARRLPARHPGRTGDVGPRRCSPSCFAAAASSCSPRSSPSPRRSGWATCSARS